MCLYTCKSLRTSFSSISSFKHGQEDTVQNSYHSCPVRFFFPVACCRGVDLTASRNNLLLILCSRFILSLLFFWNIARLSCLLHLSLSFFPPFTSFACFIVSLTRDIEGSRLERIGLLLTLLRFTCILLCWSFYGPTFKMTKKSTTPTLVHRGIRIRRSIAKWDYLAKWAC